MKKRIVIIAGIALLLGVLASSCYTSRNTCPAYRGAQTSHYRK
jgi:hypothetical protein